jgi:hypothetical protein
VFSRRSPVVVAIVCGVVLAVSASGIASANVSGWFNPNVYWYQQGTGPSTASPSGTLCYNAHVAYVGWQGWRCDGAVAGDGVHQIEALAIHTAMGQIEVQPHMANVGWGMYDIIFYNIGNGTDWVGTTGQSRRLEAIAIAQLVPYSKICGRANVLGQGWGAVQHSTGRDIAAGTIDIMTLGTWGLARPMVYLWLQNNC